MTHDVHDSPGLPGLEETLTRELRQVAEVLHVPAMPELPADAAPTRRWQPLLVAAAVALVALVAVATLLGLPGDDRIQPAPSPTPVEPTRDDADAAAEELSTAPTDVPHLVGSDLYVDGEQVPGEWLHVRGTRSGWVAMRSDGTLWWGNDPNPSRLEGFAPQFVAVSPSGDYQARVLDDGGREVLVGSGTAPGAVDFRTAPLEASSPGTSSRVVAVTDDGLVVARGADFSLLWRPLIDGTTIDLAETAPGQVVVGNTGAGLVVVEGDETTVEATDGEPYLAEMGVDGTITPLQRVPTHDDLMANGDWFAWVPPGTLGGEVPVVAELQVRRRDGGDSGVLAPPDGWDFRIGSWRWEDEDHLVATVTDGRRERVVRCSPAARECVLLDAP